MVVSRIVADDFSPRYDTVFKFTVPYADAFALEPTPRATRVVRR